jgi:Domain of unknown function (DUF4436)
VTLPTETPGDEGASGFFRRNRVRRLVIGVVMTAILVAAYLFGAQSYRAGLAQAFPAQDPPSGGVSVVIVPEQVSAEEQELPAQVLVFPSPELLDSAGLLTQELEVRLQPALTGQTLLLPAGDAPAPQSVVLPAAGIVQEYPFDSYAVSADVRVHSLYADTYDALPVEVSVFFRVPGWTVRDTASAASDAEGVVVSTELARDGSTKSIAVLMLLLMCILATIAILVTGSATRGRMKLELSVASWMTALLFALIPLRGFLPGDPPLGSWIDVLVFFWVELILMLSVAAVVTTILLRASDARHHPEEQR